MGSHVQRMLDLSTLHVPGPAPDFGPLRVVAHEYGWIVFIALETYGPEWFKPIHAAALKSGAVLVNFDQASEEVDSLPIFHDEWTLADGKSSVENVT